MAVTRRRFVHSVAAAPLASAIAAPAEAAPAAVPHAAAAPALPSLAVIALNRLGYGPRPGDVAAFNALGSTPDAQLAAYLAQQLAPDSIDDSACDQIIANARMKMRYDASTDPANPFPAVHEVRPLALLDAPLAQLWALRANNKPWQERRRPFDEVKAATCLRAAFSKRQLKEVLVDFWHNHFNVNVDSAIEIAITLPLYDKLVRTHCLGNFRAFLEDVARSPAMMYYLDNVSNQAGGGEGGNENYARELFELHTFGSDNYLKFYDDRRQIGTVAYKDAQYVAGYIDDDVYEAARCLTGWTIDPASGAFLYRDDWHDTNQKLLLWKNGDPIPNVPARQAALKDGRDVLDMLARHPGTARHLCIKLCRRLLADTPPQSVLDAAVATWMNNLSAPDQIAKVVQSIVLSSAFKTTWGQKVKRPFEAIISYIRATNAQFANDVVDASDANKGAYWGNLYYQLGFTGQQLFQWPTPTGHPDLASYWTTTNSLLRRWNLPFFLQQSWSANMQVDLVGQTSMTASCAQIVDAWIDRLAGHGIDSAVRQQLIAFLSQGGDANKAPAPVKGEPSNDPQVLADRMAALVQLLSAVPDVQYR